MEKRWRLKFAPSLNDAAVAPAPAVIEITEEATAPGWHPQYSATADYGFRVLPSMILVLATPNYERLRRSAPDIIKIDGCFVKDICTG